MAETTNALRSAFWSIAVAAVALTSASGCMELDGGAAEVAWVVRDSEQRARDCDEINVSYVRLQVLEESDGGLRDLCTSPDVDIGRCTFECDDRRGTTPFKIPEGWYYFGLAVLGPDLKPRSPDEIAVPAPIYRRVLDGEILDLGVWQIVYTQPAQ